MAMTPLSLLLLIQYTTGRYAPAALTSSVYALAGAVAGPVAGRRSDRSGPAPVLLVTGVLHPVALVALVSAVTAGSPFWLILVLAGLAGAWFPPAGGTVRGAWNTLTAPGVPWAGLRATAMAAETILLEVVFILGPALVALFVAFTSPALALYVVAAVTFLSTLIMARSTVVRAFVPHPHHARTRGLGPLRVPGFRVLVLASAGVGTAFGICSVAVPAFATAAAVAGAAGSDGASAGASAGGLILAGWGLGSAVGGVTFGALRRTRPLAGLFPWLLGALAASMAVLALMPNTVALGVALAVGGTTVAPMLTVHTSLVGRVTPETMVTEGYTWTLTVSVAASAAGGAVAGVIVDVAGPAWPFLLAGAAVGLAALVAARSVPLLAEPPSAPRPPDEQRLAAEP
jgi:MFS family permease